MRSRMGIGGRHKRSVIVIFILGSIVLTRSPFSTVAGGNEPPE